MEAYLNDPEVTSDEAKRIVTASLLNSERVTPDTTYVLVAVLASAGPPSQLSPHRFTSNLAGGNREALVWTADEIRAKAQDVISYESEWVTVADSV